MPWRQAREQSRRNNQYGVTLGRLRSLVILAVTVAWTATSRSYLPLRNHDPWNPKWEPCGPKLRCTASISVPRPTQRMRRSKETDLRQKTGVPHHPLCIRWSRRLSLNQRVASVGLDANACRRTVVTWYSCPWMLHRLNTHPKTSKPTNASSHKRQQWIYKPRTESRCRSLNRVKCCLPEMPTLAQPLSCYHHPHFQSLSPSLNDQVCP